MIKSKKVYHEDDYFEYDNIYNLEREELYVDNAPSIWYT